MHIAGGGPVVSIRARALAALAFVVACAASSACGSTSSGTAPPSSGVSVPPSTPVSQLGAADVSLLCQFYVDGFPPADTCRYVAVALTSGGQGTASELQAQCNQAEQQCVDGYSTTAATMQTACEEGWFTEPCTATVAQVEGCIRDITTEYGRLYASVGSCASDLSGPFQAPQGTLSSACLATIEKCPTLFGGTTEVTPPPPANPTVASCQQACDAYVRACSLDACPDSCDIVVSVYGEACDAIGKRFFDCAATSTISCSQTDWTLASDGCAAERADYLTCFGLDGPTCVRQAGLDASCNQSDPALPFAQQCVTEAAPAECQLYAGTSNIYCCPTQ